jgi:hypothetical protein
MASVDGGGKTFQNPGFSPYTEPKFYGTWIKIVDKKIKFQTALTNTDGGLVLDTSYEGTTWKYLAPSQIMETINNTWEPWETIASRLAGKGKEFKQIYQEGSNLAGSLWNQKSGVDVGKLFTNLSSVKKEKTKVDTPLVYENSERREYTLQFNLVCNNEMMGNGSPEMMMQGIKDLEFKSLPTRNENDYGLGIDLPHVFSVQSMVLLGNEEMDQNIPMISIGFAAITSIQPTYMAPYDTKGNPMRVELTITFKELPPLYSDSLYEAV